MANERDATCRLVRQFGTSQTLGFGRVCAARREGSLDHRLAVFHAGKTNWLLDAGTRKTGRLTTTKRTPIGLSIDANRKTQVDAAGSGEPWIRLVREQLRTRLSPRSGAFGKWP
jgi:hypothetical protein